MAQRVTIQDIADALGLSRNTVSKAINNSGTLADSTKEKILLKGELTSPINPKPGCRFASRCPYATDQCRQESPVLTEVKPGHFAACHHLDKCN